MWKVRAGLRFGAVVGGLLLAAGIQVLLMSLGGAIGLTAFSTADQTTGELQIGYAAWLVGSLFVSVFIGGWAAGAGARSPFRGDGALHGAVTWAAISIAGFFLVGNNLDDILGGALRVAGETAVASAPPEVKPEVKQHVSGTVEQVKETLQEVGDGVKTLEAVDDAREVVAIGLWSFLGVEVLLLLAAIAGGALGGRASTRRAAMLPASP
jgi:hypothetical protein